MSPPVGMDLEGFSQMWRGLAYVSPAPCGEAVDPADTGALLRAARRARERYPGAVGDLVAEEITAFLRVGRRFAGPSTIMRVVAELLEDERD